MAGPSRVRLLGITAAVSLAVHGGALGWVISRPKPEPLQVLSAAPAVVTVEDTVTEVVLLPDDAPTPPAIVPQVPRVPGTSGVTAAPRGKAEAGKAQRVVATASSAGPAGPETAPPTTSPPATGQPQKKPSILSMRDLPDIPRVGDQLAQNVADHPVDYGPLPDYPGQRDQQALEVAKAQHDIQGVIAAREAIKNEELKPQKDGTWKVDKTPFIATVDKDGTMHIKDKQNFQRKGWFYATFDVTDALMRSHGADPYSSQKLELLDRTRDQRVEIAKAYRKEQLSHSAQLMQANLERLWAMTQDVAARKQGVFDLWEDCAETGEPEVVAGASEARALLERFVQVHLKGSNAFTTDELARLNAKRRSKASFDPYQ